MPVALDPNKRFEVVLESDKSLPDKQRPTFIFRHLTAREFMSSADDCDALSQSGSGRQALDSILSRLGKGIVGWRNMNGIEFSADKLADLLTVQEAGELLSAMVKGNQVEAQDAGKSA